MCSLSFMMVSAPGLWALWGCIYEPRPETLEAFDLPSADRRQGIIWYQFWYQNTCAFLVPGGTSRDILGI